MNSLLIKSAKIIDPTSPFNGKIADVLIEKGIITKIGTNINADVSIINGENKYLSVGFFDLNANPGQLGTETKEDFNTAEKAAAAGGFTGMLAMPNTQPPVHSKSEISYLKNLAQNRLVDILPAGTISFKQEGADLSEMYDMHLNGAVAFTDGQKPVQNAGLMERALLYANGFNGLIISFAEDASIAGKAKINEGEVSTLLGMKGIPAMAEEIMINRDLYLAAYTHSKIHFTTISTAGSVELIRQAKKNGLQVSCDVAAHHLVFTENNLMDFDSNYKVKPPLRTVTDQKALIAGLKDGTIDAIVSQHTPHEIEFKNVEFEIASFGLIGLQTAFSNALTAGLKPEELVQKLAINPRNILGIALPAIKENEKANLVLFDEQNWLYNSNNNYSKSSNSPQLNRQLKGRISLTLNNNQLQEFNHSES